MVGIKMSHLSGCFERLGGFERLLFWLSATCMKDDQIFILELPDLDFFDCRMYL